jgi:hypothetical protein
VIQPTQPIRLVGGEQYLSRLLRGRSVQVLPAAGGGVAWWAHIGGFIAGIKSGYERDLLPALNLVMSV